MAIPLRITFLAAFAVFSAACGGHIESPAGGASEPSDPDGTQHGESTAAEDDDGQAPKPEGAAGSESEDDDGADAAKTESDGDGASGVNEPTDTDEGDEMAPEGDPDSPLDDASEPGAPFSGCDEGQHAVCDGFEHGLTTPPWYAGGNRSLSGIDDGLAHEGRRSLRVTGATWVSTTSLSGPYRARFFARFFMRVADIPNKHTVFVEAHGTHGGSDFEAQLDVNAFAGVSLRYRHRSIKEHGGRKANVKENISAGAWACFELEFDAGAGVLRLWRDGHAAPVELNGLQMSPAKGFRIGQRGYGGRAVSVWFDDVVIAQQRIGCP